MRAARGANERHTTVLRWPWHRTVAVWAEARDMHEDTWGLLLAAVGYKRQD